MDRRDNVAVRRPDPPTKKGEKLAADLVQEQAPVIWNPLAAESSQDAAMYPRKLIEEGRRRGLRVGLELGRGPLMHTGLSRIPRRPCGMCLAKGEFCYAFDGSQLPD